ncbi:MAG: rRNA maturation RNase YbeY [Nitrospirota bacterium]
MPVAVAAYRLFLLKLLAATGRSPAMIGLTFVDDSVMRRLNRKYRRIDRATDVLAFPAEPLAPDAEPPPLGDIVISAETARRQAAGPGAGAVREECRRLLIHGYLHLLGYDHERSPREARRMQRMERRLDAQLSRKK